MAERLPVKQIVESSKLSESAITNKKGCVKLEYKNEEGFNNILKMWSQSNGNSTTPLWKILSEKYKDTPEAIKSWFKRERQKRGMNKETNRTMQQNPVVAVFDIETMPLKIAGHLWGIRDQYIPHTMIEDSWRMLSWSAKILGETKIYSDIMTPKEAIERNSFRVVSTLRSFLEKVDIVIAHNGDEFDIKTFNSELIYYEMKPLKYRSIDTLKLIRKNFNLPSYKLAFINDYFGITKKIKNEGQGLWDKCLTGDKNALKEMRIYNEGDIVANEDLFWRIQPYCSDIPNFSTYNNKLDARVCNCGGKLSSDKKHPYWYTNLAKYERLVCDSCGAIHRGRKNLLEKNVKNNFVSLI